MRPKTLLDVFYKLTQQHLFRYLSKIELLFCVEDFTWLSFFEINFLKLLLFEIFKTGQCSIS